MFENVDGWSDDGRTDAGVTGILLAHPWAFGSGELKSNAAVPEKRFIFLFGLSSWFLFLTPIVF